MINYDSILSAFDGKPTLLQWLKMVKKALDESVLKDVTIEKDADNVAFTFNFEDGTSVTTPKVTLPKGDKGDKGDTGATGPKGDAGVSITGIDTVSGQVVGDETLTTLRANYSDETSSEFVVTAKNGKDASSASNIYLHSVKIYDSGYSIFFNIYSTKDSLTLNDAFEQIPNINISSNFSSNKIPATFSDGSKMGVVSVGKYISLEKTYIRVDGIVFPSSGPFEYYSVAFNPTSIDDTLLGVV